MEPNSLVVAVIGARGLFLKGHSKLEAFVSISLNNEKWKNKVQTNIQKNCGECTWDERCELDFTDLDAVLTILVHHRTVLGLSECIGGIELILRTLLGKTTQSWYHLRKKGKFSENNQKYRGEILLKFEFLNKLSASSLSINTIDGVSKLSALKRRMRFGRKKDLDTKSLLDVPRYMERSSFSGAYCIAEDEDIESLNERDEGLITPPYQSGSPIDLASAASQTILNSENGPRLRSFSTTLPNVIRADKSPMSLNRAPSLASSGFSSARSTVVGSIFGRNFSNPSVKELMELVEELRKEIDQKETTIADLQNYIDRLVTKVMFTNPGLLESKSK